MKHILLIILSVLLVSCCPIKQTADKGQIMNVHEHINYIEFPAKDMAATKTFFTDVFDWSFTEYGPDYMDARGGGLSVGFYKSDLAAHYQKGSALIVFYSKELEATQAKIEQAGGTVTRPIFAFPGGRRFHFADPSGNEYGVWSDL